MADNLYAILMSAPMVRGLLREARAPGTGKTQSRRPAWRPCRRCDDTGRIGYDHHMDPIQCPVCREERLPTIWRKVEPGDRLWVRETWKFLGTDMARLGRTHTRQDGVVQYRSDDAKRTITTHWENVEVLMASRPGHRLKWRPSIHMPRWASRLTLVVTATRMQRLQNISEDDAEAEGLNDSYPDPGPCKWRHPTEDKGTSDPIRAFGRLWNSLHGPGAWEANPEVVPLTFTVHERNIDAIGALLDGKTHGGMPG